MLRKIIEAKLQRSSQSFEEMKHFKTIQLKPISNFKPQTLFPA